MKKDESQKNKRSSKSENLYKKFIKLYKNHQTIITIIAIILSFFADAILQGGTTILDNRGYHFFGLQFTTFEYEDFDKFIDDYPKEDNKTKTLYIINKYEFDLRPFINISIEPPDSEIIISCREQQTNYDCTKGFPIENKKSSAIDFLIRIGNPKLNSYNLCIKTIDSRSFRSTNYRFECREINISDSLRNPRVDIYSLLNVKKLQIFPQ